MSKHVFVDRHQDRFLELEPGVEYHVQQTMVVADDDGEPTFWHEIVPLDEVYPAADDRVEVYRREDGRFGWRRRDGRNAKIVSTDGGQGYENEAECRVQAAKRNPDVEVV